MEVTLQIKTTGLEEIDEKIKKVSDLMAEVKALVNEINNASVSFTVNPS